MTEIPGAPQRGAFFILGPYPDCLTLNDSSTSFKASTRVLVRPIGLDMVEVGGSIKCDYRSIWHRAPQACSPQGQNRLKPVLGNPPGPTKFSSLCFYSTLFFRNRAFWRVSMCGRHLGKVVIDPSVAKVLLKHHYRTISVQGTRSMSPPNASGSQKISKRDGCTLWPLGNCSSAKDSSETFSGMDVARSLCSVGSFSS